MMNQIEHLECEIAEFKIELDRHYQSIHNLNSLIDRAQLKLEDLRRRETLEQYKPQLEGLVDKYIDNGIVEYPYDSNLKLHTRGTRHKDFDAILGRFKCFKEQGKLIYLYKIGEPNDLTDEYFVSYIVFDKK
jgi:hypothetical protein